MRLLNSISIRLEEFFDDHIPKYAVLSHRWQGDEVTFQHMQHGTAVNKVGYDKIKLCCAQAARDGLQYVWIDTCCIDKTNSAELSEAINSMYQWYQHGVVCYVHLFDVQTMDPSSHASFDKSVWFKRGWTLQELIAPPFVEFYDMYWRKLGTKITLKNKIVSITRIDVGVLEGMHPDSFSVAKRMSWASNRTTTRVEDVAYSLLGLFDVNMPMLYGEGNRAFLRLQEEIMKHSDDHSLFAWTSTDDCYRGLLAKSPADFAYCQDIICSSCKLNRNPYSITNMGLSIELPMIAWGMDTYLAALDCEKERVPNSRLGIYLKLLPENNQCARVRLDRIDRATFESQFNSLSEHRRIYVRQKIWGSLPPMDRMYGFLVRQLPSEVEAFSERGNSLSEVVSYNKWSNNERILRMPAGSRGTAGVLWFKSESKYSVLRLGFDSNFNPVCQFGGPLWGPTAESYTPEGKEVSFETKMDNKWMTNGTGAIFTGDRVTGLRVEPDGARVKITDEVTDKYRVWAIDVEYTNSNSSQGGRVRHNGVFCDGCSQTIYGTRFKCRFCLDFDYCEKCMVTSKSTHPNHEFKAIDT